MAYGNDLQHEQKIPESRHHVQQCFHTLQHIQISHYAVWPLKREYIGLVETCSVNAFKAVLESFDLVHVLISSIYPNLSRVYMTFVFHYVYLCACFIVFTRKCKSSITILVL